MDKKRQKVVALIIDIIIILSITILSVFYLKEYLKKEKPKFNRKIFKQEKITSLKEEKDTLVIGLYIDNKSRYDRYVFLIKNGEDYETAWVEETKIEKEDTEPYYIEYSNNFFEENIPKENYKLVLPEKTKIININYKQIDSIIKNNREKHIKENINKPK